MPRHARQTAKSLAHKSHAKVAPLPRTGVASVQVAVVTDFDVRGLQGGAQCGFDVGCRDGHGGAHEVRFGGSASLA
jgi:hypothetical protein